MTALDRRQTPRTTMAKHAYINIEPNNGGIVLNVSDGGLCFHSFDRVPPDGTVRFWFSDNNQRIEATGAVTWTDETQKGGLRFTDLPAEARDKIRNWMTQPGIVLRTDEGFAPAGPRPRAPLGAGSVAEIVPSNFVPPALLLPAPQAPRPWSAFSRGLATGLLASAVVASGFLFNNYRSQLGELLIRLGERFAAKPQAETVVVSAAAPEILAPAPLAALAAAAAPAPAVAIPKTEPSPTPTAVSSVPPKELLKRQPEPAPQPEKLAPSLPLPAAKAQPAPIEPPKPAVTSSSTVANPAPKAPITAAAPATSSFFPL